MLRPSLRVAQRCCACSSKLLGRSHVSTLPNLASATSRISPPFRSTQKQTLQNYGFTARTYSTSDSSQHQPDHEPEQDVGPPAVHTAENDSAVEETKPPSTSDLPWYLQVEPPRHPTLIPQQYPLPEIPPDAPKLLEPLIKFVSDELGIDRLTLLDLRDLDPPPALGPKLLMVFGSARMERHLHVSADRLVRWLASHGIQAEADGLMSRNELKLKMRRAARRNKTITAAGGSASGDNQALATSWICVNLGTMGWSSDEVAITDSEGRVAGFGAPQTGTTMVVQLFTEAKRKELDLETLWGRQLERSERRAAEIAGTPKPRPVDPFLEQFGDAAEPNRKTRRQTLQNKGF